MSMHQRLFISNFKKPNKLLFYTQQLFYEDSWVKNLITSVVLNDSYNIIPNVCCVKINIMVIYT
jgi:hypothetical protein